MRRSRLQFLQRMADWNLRSCNGMLVKSGWVVCWQPKDHNHNTSIWNIICSKHQSLFTQTVGFYWTEAFPFPNAWNISMPWSHLSHALVAGTGQSTAHSWLLWMFIFENYADPSLDRHRRLIGMRPGTRFFIYGMNGLEVLLQMPTSTHGLTSLAKITGIWQNMLPVCLSIGGFNICSPIPGMIHTPHPALNQQTVLEDPTCKHFSPIVPVPDPPSTQKLIIISCHRRSKHCIEITL